MTTQTQGAADAERPASELDAQAARLYVAVGRLVRMLRRGSDADLGPGTFSALATLVQHGPMRLGELASREGVAPPTLTRIVGALEEAGLVVRQTDPSDRRASLVAATGQGTALAAGVRSARAAALSERLAALADGDRRTLLAALPVLEGLVAEE